MYNENTRKSIYKYRANNIEFCKAYEKNYRLENAVHLSVIKSKWFKDNKNEEMLQRLRNTTARWKAMKIYFSYDLVAKSFRKINL